MPSENPQVVLLIEDKKNVRKTLRDHLEECDYTVLEAENSQAGLAVFEREAVDLVLLDLRLPEGDGPDFLARFRQRTPDTPILALAGAGQTGDAAEAVRQGAWDYVFEPIEDKTLFLHTVEKALERSRFIRESRNYQERIREIEENSHVLFENTISAITYFNTEHKVLLANNKSAASMGFDREEIIGKSIFDLLPPHQAEMFQRRLIEIAEKNEEAQFEDSGDFPEGRRWFLSNMKPVTDSEGGITGIVSVAIDITDRKKAEAALSESEERYRLVLENAPNAIVVYSPEGRVLMLNEIGGEFLNGTPDEFIGKSVYEIFSDKIIPQMAEGTMGVIQKVIESESSETVSAWAEYPRGKCYVTANFQPVKDDDGRLVGVQAIVTDLTAQKLAEAALGESEEKYKLLFENAVIPITYVALDGKILMLNTVAAANLGGKPEDFIGKYIMESFSPEQVADGKKLLSQIIESQPGIKFEWKQRLPGGDRWFLAHSQAVRDANGNITANQTVMSDITELKEAQEELRKHRDHLDKLVAERTGELERKNEELRQLKNLLTNIVDSMPSVLVGVDLEGRVIQWNQGAHNETGISEEKARGRSVTAVFPKLSEEMDKVRQAVRDREPKQDTKVAWKTNGETRYISVTVFPLITNGVEGAVIRVDDVTGQVRMEQMMIQSEKMLTVGGLAAGMAHEINNPLAAIIQTVQVIGNRVSSSLDKNRRVAEECGIEMRAIETYMDRRGIFSMIESVMESGLRCAKTVENMLSFSRKSEMRFSPHDLRELMDATVDLASKDYDLKKRYEFSDIEIVREYDPATPRVLCEASEIQQVFLNILRNGAEEMAGTRDEEKRPHFILRVTPEGDMARIEIEDNGPGMDKETPKRIFEPFFTTKDVGVGTGLGLSVSYFIITEHHRGTLAVDSKQGRGATFIIRLPIKT